MRTGAADRRTTDYFLLIFLALSQNIKATCLLLCFTADSQLENETIQEADSPNRNNKANMNSSTRDSGCHTPSDNPDPRPEDTDLLNL